MNNCGNAFRTVRLIKNIASNLTQEVAATDSSENPVFLPCRAIHLPFLYGGKCNNLYLQLRCCYQY